MTINIEGSLSRSFGSSGGETTVEVKLDPIAKTKPTNRHVALLIDTSGSMAGPKIQNAKDGAKSALRELGNKDYVSIVGFNARTEVVLPMTKWDKADESQVINDIEKTSSGGGTDIYKGLEEVRDQLVHDTPTDTQSVKRIILLSDGQDRYTPATYRDLASEFAEDGISIMAAGVGSGYDDAVMVALANASGGQAANLGEDDINQFLSETVSATDNVVAPNPRLEITPQEGFLVKDTPAYFSAPKVEERPIDTENSPATVDLPELQVGAVQQLTFEMLGQPKSPGLVHEIARLQVVDSTGSTLGETMIEAEYAEESALEKVDIEKERTKAKVTRQIQDAEITDAEVTDEIDAIAERGWKKTADELRDRLQTASEDGGLIKISNSN